MRECRENQQQAAKEVRQFWIFWGTVGAAALGYVFAHYVISANRMRIDAAAS